MNTLRSKRLSGLAALALLGLLGGCAPAPIYTVAPGTPVVQPAQAAQAPEQYRNATMIWGGTVVDVQNFSDHSEIEMLSYPLDRSQRPRIARDKGNGRFIAVLPGYVEPLNFPPGTPMTVRGTFDGVHAGHVGQADYLFPRVKVEQHHAWTVEEMRQGHPNFSFGMGVGVGSGGASGVGVGVGVH